MQPEDQMIPSLPRRLHVEKLESRSVLAAMLGISHHPLESSELQSAAKIELASFADSKQAISFQLNGPATMLPLEVRSADVTHFPVVASETATPLSFQISEVDTQVDLRETVVSSGRLTDLTFIKNWQVREIDNWLPMIRTPGLIRIRDLDTDDLPVIEPGWGTVDTSPIGGPGNDSSPIDPGINDPVSPPLDAAPESTAPALPAADIATESEIGQLPWLELTKTPDSRRADLRHTSYHSTARREGRTAFTTNLNDHDSESEVSSLESEGQSLDSIESINNLLELPIARVEVATASAFNSRDVSAAIAAHHSHLERRAAINSSAIHSAEVAPPEFSVQPEFIAPFDEGGLVELVAGNTIRSVASSNPSIEVQTLRGVIEAEVGLFQAIEVAADSSHAVFYPAVLIALFQLFDQRRRVEDIDRRFTPGF